MTRIIAFRLEADSAVALRAAATLRGLAVSQFIREAIHREIQSSADGHSSADYSATASTGANR